MAYSTVIVANHSKPLSVTGGRVTPTGRSLFRFILNFLWGLLGGAKAGTTVQVFPDGAEGVTAVGKVTLASCSAGAVIDINGVPFTAVSGTAKSGANEFAQSGTDTQDAAALAASINACTDARISGILTATSASGVVTLTAALKAGLGNALLLRYRGVRASGSVTCASVANNDTVTVDGTVYTAKSASPSGTQQYLIGATDAATATALAAAVNATLAAGTQASHRATIDGTTAAKVNIRSLYDGVAGNAQTIASSNGTRLAITGGAARLTGGTAVQPAASGTVTVVGADGGTYTTTVNGVAINATGTNGDDTATAASIAAAINASTNALVAGHVRATAALGVVTITAASDGPDGNAITLAATGTGATASGTRLANGSASTVVAMSNATGAVVYSYGETSTEARFSAGAGGASTVYTITL